MTTERDIQNQIDFAMDKGREEGREEDREEGREEGREEERIKNQLFIESLRKQGVPEEIIAKALTESN